MPPKPVAPPVEEVELDPVEAERIMMRNLEEKHTLCRHEGTQRTTVDSLEIVGFRFLIAAQEKVLRPAEYDAKYKSGQSKSNSGTVHVKQLTGNRGIHQVHIPLLVDKTTTVLDMKAMVKEAVGKKDFIAQEVFTVEKQRLFYMGKELTEGTLQTCAVPWNATLHLTVRN